MEIHNYSLTSRGTYKILVMIQILSVSRKKIPAEDCFILYKLYKEM